jgi:hypothetical protein
MPNGSNTFSLCLNPKRAVICGALLAAMLAGVDRAPADAAVIFVTSFSQKVSSVGGCSLQEAIFSANFDTNQINTPTTFFQTACVPGNGR